MFPLNICIWGPNADGTHVIYSTEPVDSTQQKLFMTVYSNSDCTQRIEGPFEVGITCAGLSSIPLAGFFMVETNYYNCSNPSGLQGIVKGVCYQNIQQETSFQFQSCGSDATYTLSTYIGTDCTGASKPEVIPYSPTCDETIGMFGWCTPSPTVEPTKSPVSASVKGSWFVGSEAVILESGTAIPLSKVRVGDRILSGNALGKLRFSVVISAPRETYDLPATVLLMELENGFTLKLTADHLLLRRSYDSHLSLVSAASLTVGEFVRTLDGDKRIFSVREIQAEGLFTAVTEEELIVVSGVLASPLANIADCDSSLSASSGLRSPTRRSGSFRRCP